MSYPNYNKYNQYVTCCKPIGSTGPSGATGPVGPIAPVLLNHNIFEPLNIDCNFYNNLTSIIYIFNNKIYILF